MHQVKGEYPDYSRPSNKSYFFLNADQSFNPFTWRPPIHWGGQVGGVAVTFTQISNSGSDRIDYDWSQFPKEVENAIPYIVEAIDDAMRVMD